MGVFGAHFCDLVSSSHKPSSKVVLSCLGFARSEPLKLLVYSFFINCFQVPETLFAGLGGSENAFIAFLTLSAQYLGRHHKDVK